MPQRILVVRVGRAGDLVMITPALRMILDAFPGAELHLLGSSEAPRVLRGFDPRLTRIHLYHRRFPESLLLPRRTARSLALEGFERAYVFETNPHYRRLVAGVAPQVFALAEAGAEAHYAARCLELVEATLAVPPARGWIHLPVTEAGRAAAAATLAGAGLDPNARLVGLHLTYSESARSPVRDREGRRHREWPLASWAELARRLREGAPGGPLQPIVDVLPNERAIVEPFVREAGDSVRVLCGPPDFERYKALLERLALFVTPNTGPMHVAAAVGTPVVALFSGWSPADSGPFAPPERVRVLRAEDVRPGADGLAAIDPAAVRAACLAMLR